MSNQKLIFALALYGLLALLAGFTISQREMKLAVWVLMGGLALKTLVASQQLRAQHSAKATEGSGTDKVDPNQQEHP